MNAVVQPQNDQHATAAPSGQSKPKSKSKYPKQRPFARQYSPSESSAVMQRGLTLKSLQAQRIFKSHFDPGSSAIYYIVKMMKILKAPPSLIQSTKAELLTIVNELEQELDAELARLSPILEGELYDSVAYTKPIEVVARFHTPLAGRWLSLIQKLDQVVECIDTLWMGSHPDYIDDDTQLEAVTMWQNKVGALGKAIFGLEKRARAAVSTRQAQEEQRIEAHNEAVEHGLASGLEPSDLPPTLPPPDVNLHEISEKVDADARLGIGSTISPLEQAA
jgi:hypothetical protein